MAGQRPVFQVLLTSVAERDIESLRDYVTRSDGLPQADRPLDRLMEAMEGLAHFPERGSHPKELLALGIKEYRQVFFKPYRLIYRVTGKRMMVFLVVDGRRDMQSVLARRLLGA